MKTLEMARAREMTESERRAAAWRWRGIDPDFDAAVLTLAKVVLPSGYDAVEAAPSTFEDLCALLDRGEKMKVWSGASGHTIYGSPEVNYAFRAWHDWNHWKGQHPFSFVGEAATAWRQVEQLREIFGADHPALRLWSAYVFAEVVGQALYAFLNNGAFPNNQRVFVKRFLEPLLEVEPDMRLPGEGGET